MPPADPRRWTAVLATGEQHAVHTSRMTLGWSSWTTDPDVAWFADTEEGAVRRACERSWTSPVVELVPEGEPTRSELAARCEAAEQRAADAGEHAARTIAEYRAAFDAVARGFQRAAARAEEHAADTERLAADILAAGLAECERLRERLAAAESEHRTYVADTARLADVMRETHAQATRAAVDALAREAAIAHERAEAAEAECGRLRARVAEQRHDVERARQTTYRAVDAEHERDEARAEVERLGRLVERQRAATADAAAALRAGDAARAAAVLDRALDDPGLRVSAERAAADAAPACVECDRLRGEVRAMQVQAERRNRELDALHYVWCDGGCERGVHRFGEHPPLTRELVEEAIRNTERLARRLWNQQGRVGEPPDATFGASPIVEVIGIARAYRERMWPAEQRAAAALAEVARLRRALGLAAPGEPVAREAED